MRIPVEVLHPSGAVEHVVFESGVVRTARQLGVGYLVVHASRSLRRKHRYHADAKTERLPDLVGRAGVRRMVRQRRRA